MGHININFNITVNINQFNSVPVLNGYFPFKKSCFSHRRTSSRINVQRTRKISIEVLFGSCLLDKSKDFASGKTRKCATIGYGNSEKI